MNKNISIWAYMPVTFITALFCCLLWGSASPAIKIAYKLFNIAADDTASRIMLAGARFMIAGAMTVILGSVIARLLLLPKRGSVKYIAILSLLQTVGQYFFFFMSLAYISGVRGSIINASGNFLAILAAVYVFRLEKLTMRKFTGCLIGFAGIVMILGGPSALTGSSISIQGEGAMIAATLFYAFSACCIKIFSSHENPVILSGYQFALGGLILYIIGWVMGGELVFYSASCIYNLIYMGFISAGAYTLWGILLKHNPVSRVSVFGFINPVMGVVLSAVFLGENKEAFSLTGLLSLVMVALGIIIVNTNAKAIKN
ncbi:DMT family transporter [Butyrivibrio sp. MC2013]|uniref:DMT family transporter n=1 Tax=Butyrivibrio sp. MC2013 TaxID=1280686 RepID=UPI00040077DC|nr:DMT family transporter [Butyrivibrio sp. MC2013]